jgi:hypothetical protein
MTAENNFDFGADVSPILHPAMSRVPGWWRRGSRSEARELTMNRPDYTKETKTAEELQRMILEDLRNVGGGPERGVSVTVYGIP